MIKFINKRRRNSKGGFTLMEVIIALGIFCLLALVVAVMFETVIKLQFITNETDNQVDKRIGQLDDNSGLDEYADETFEIKFNDVDKAIEANKVKVGSGGSDDRLPLRTFE